MTTEIAVANRLGIALASDSAVTITGRGRVKVFDTADKLFELSAVHPVGVMINGNMDCLGVPWEILVKDFRETDGIKKRAKITDWTSDFVAFVQAHALIGDDSTKRYTQHVIANEIETIQRSVSSLLLERIRAESPRTTGEANAVLSKLIFEEIKKRSEYLQQFPVADSLKFLNVAQIIEKYADEIDSLSKERFKPTELSQNELEGIREISGEALLRAFPSGFVAGVVIGGFGCEETFPSVHAIEVDGRVCGRLKITETESKSIATSEDGGQVTHFAQTDVIQRLLEGADPRFIERTSEFIEKAVKTVASTIETATRPRRVSKAKAADREKLVQEIVEIIKKEYEDETAENLKKQFSREFDRMIAMMPKQELIELAEALVSITAVERKATSDEGTVGGLIDVAFITKHEGFVWIKRKHYFPKDLNPTYFWRKYAIPPTEKPHDETTIARAG